MNTNPSSILKCLCTFTVGVFVLFVATFFLAVLPLQEKIRTENEEIQKFRAKIENSERKLSRLPEFESQSGTIQRDGNTLRMLVPEAEVVRFIEKIESLAREESGEVGISQGSDAVHALNPTSGDEVADGSVQSSIRDTLPWEKVLWLDVKFSGGYTGAVNFLHKMETLPYGLDVVSIGMRSADSDEDFRKGGDVMFIAPQDTEGSDVQEPSKEPLVEASFEIAVYLE